MQKRLNQSRCCLRKHKFNCIHQVVPMCLMGRHIGITWWIRVNRLPWQQYSLMSYYFDHLLVIMAALRNRGGPLYFCPVVSIFYLLFFFIPRLISAAADWMSTILLHMVWPLCEFRMQIWNVLHAARWKCRTPKSPKNRHLGTIEFVGLYLRN